MSGHPNWEADKTTNARSGDAIPQRANRILTISGNF
jgi:hypothetical protein